MKRTFAIQQCVNCTMKKRELIISCGASSYRGGAVLAHCISDGEEKPIEIASCTLSGAEKNCSQLDKEGFAVHFGVQYLQ